MPLAPPLAPDGSRGIEVTAMEVPAVEVTAVEIPPPMGVVEALGGDGLGDVGGIMEL